MSLKHSVTARKRSCGKVMFLHLSVSHYSVHSQGGVSNACNGPAGECIPECNGPGGVHPHQSTSGQYASYWNAFLFNVNYDITFVNHYCAQLCVTSMCQYDLYSQGSHSDWENGKAFSSQGKLHEMLSFSDI